MAENWTTPEADGWHWLLSHSTGRHLIGRYHGAAKMWDVFSSSGGMFRYAPEDMPRYFNWRGPIEEPATNG